MPKPPLLDNAGSNPYAMPPSQPPAESPPPANPYRAPAADMRHAYSAVESRGILSLLFSFSGRVGRGMYWLIGIGAMFVFYSVMFASIGVLGEDVGAALMVPLYIVWLWIGLANSAKRWHDRNKSAWWILIALVPLIGPLWVFIEQGFLPGDSGPNRFGAPPA